MRIDPTSPTVIEAREAQAPAKPAKAGPTKDVVELSAAATAQHTTDISAKLSRIRELLQRGAYPVDLDALAARIVDDEALRSQGSS